MCYNFPLKEATRERGLIRRKTEGAAVELRETPKTYHWWEHKDEDIYWETNWVVYCQTPLLPGTGTCKPLEMMFS